MKNFFGITTLLRTQDWRLFLDELEIAKELKNRLAFHEKTKNIDLKPSSGPNQFHLWRKIFYELRGCYWNQKDLFWLF